MTDRITADEAQQILDGLRNVSIPALAQTVIDQAEQIDALSSALRFMYETYNTDIARLAAELPDDAVVYDAESKQPDGEAVMNAAVRVLEQAREADQ
jgi:hypothetical protein